MALSKITTESLLDGEITAAKFATGVGGKVVQVVNTQTSALSSGTTVMTRDTSIPQISEGITAGLDTAITPTNASNKLLIEVVLWAATSAGPAAMELALFQDSTANALAASGSVHNAANWEHCLTLNYYMAAGTTSATTFKARAGSNSSGTTYINGLDGAITHGAAIKSSMTITEILA